MNPRFVGLFVGSALLGAAILALAIGTSRETGPGSGFKGYTTGFRVRLWLTYALGLLLLAQGVVGIGYYVAAQGRARAPRPASE